MFKARMKFAKTGRAKYISHLDLMHTMQRSIARAGLPIWFTEGFNQHAYISIALPLSTGFSGEWEFMDFQLLTEIVPEDAVERMNAAFPEGLQALEIYPLSEGGRPVREISWSGFRITYDFDSGVPQGFAEDVQAVLARESIELMKRSKRGEKLVNIRDMIRETRVEAEENQVRIYAVTASDPGGNNLSPEYITRAIETYGKGWKIDGAAYHRYGVYDDHMELFR